MKRHDLVDFCLYLQRVRAHAAHEDCLNPGEPRISKAERVFVDAVLPLWPMAVPIVNAAAVAVATVEYILRDARIWSNTQITQLAEDIAVHLKVIPMYFVRRTRARRFKPENMVPRQWCVAPCVAHEVSSNEYYAFRDALEAARVDRIPVCQWLETNRPADWHGVTGRFAIDDHFGKRIWIADDWKSVRLLP